MATLKNLTVNDTGFIQIASGTTGDRPGSPVAGMMPAIAATRRKQQLSNEQTRRFSNSSASIKATQTFTMSTMQAILATYLISQASSGQS